MNAGWEEEDVDGTGDPENARAGRTVLQRTTGMETAIGATETGKVKGQISLIGKPE
jgi:hypothetical protein